MLQRLIIYFKKDKIMKRILLFAICSAFVTLSRAQTIKGKIVDASSKNPLSGATISVAGKNISTSDKDGMFSFSCSKEVTIVVTFVGYEIEKKTVECNDVLTIELTHSANTLDNVDITATSSQNKSLLSQPVSITKLTATELKRGQGLFLDDVIQTSVPGVIMNRRTVSGGQQFNIRGYGNGSRGTRGINSNFDGQGYKVYLNGIPVTDAEGITTLDDVDYASIGNAEIVKGPAGTLYGQAIAGAINFKITAPEKGKTTIGQNIMLGNYGLQRFTTQLTTGGERSSLLLTYGKQKSDGFSIHNKSHKDFVNFAGEFQPNEKQSVTTYVGYTDSYDQRLGELTLTQYQTKDYTGNIEYIKRDGHSHVSTFRAGLSHTYSFNKTISNTTSIFGTGFRSDVSSAGGWTDKTSVNYGFRSSFNSRFSLGSGSSLNGITGIEVQRQDAQVVGYNMKAAPSDPNPGGPWVLGTSPYWIVNAVTANTAFVTTPTSYFTEWTLAFQHDLSITGGIGLSTQRIILDDRFNSPNATVARPTHYDTSYKGMVSPHLAINKVFNKGFSAYASYSVGYKAPVSSYFFVTTPIVGATPATAKVNGELKPEKGTQFEIGSKGTVLKDKFVYQLAFFSLKFTNKMTAVSVPVPATPPTATAYSYMINGGDQDHKGIEAAIKYSIVKDGKGVFSNITPFFTFTYSDFKYGNNFIYKTGSTTAAGGIDTVNYSNLNVFGVPKIMTAWGIDVAMKCGIYASFSHLYKDGVNVGLDRVTQNPESYILRKATSYNLLNTKFGFRRSISSHFDLDAFFGVNNITGVQYPIMIFINQLPDAYIPAPPKAVVFGGINLKYNIH
jgi:iron complex outermembrane receptor protein